VRRPPCRAWLVFALLALARSAAAETRLDVNNELRQAEEFRKDQERRRQLAKMRIQIDPGQDLRLIEHGTRPPRHIPDARYRVAVFSFEDPDGTGLGNALAALVGREMLLKSNVGSIGVLRYEGSLAPSPAQPSSYFDKVELLVEAQEVTLAVWGMVRRSGDQVWIDTYAQLPPRVVDESFSWSLRLPAAMGSQKLVAHLRPARIMVQRHQMSLDDARSLATLVKGLDTLRGEPDDGAPVVSTLPVGSVYWVSRRQGDWVEIVAGANKGWARSTAQCIGGCAPLLEAVRFTAGLLEFIQSRAVPEATANLGPDAAAVQTQLSVMEQLDTTRPGQFEPFVLQPLARWLDGGVGTAATPPGGAAFANIRALGAVATSLQARVRRSDEPLERRFDEVALAPSRAREIAFELAQASLADPRNPDVLGNLAVLFRQAGEGRRAELAATLAAAATASDEPSLP
jgi:hypothetical protein